MTALAQAQCESCRADAPKVSDEELAELIREIPDWNIEVRGDHMELERVFLFRNFRHALAFTNAVGAIAEKSATIPPCSPSGARSPSLVEPRDARPAPQRLHHGRPHRPARRQRGGPQVMHFGQIPRVPGDPILGLMDLYRADTNPAKLDLGVGVYKDAQA